MLWKYTIALDSLFYYTRYLSAMITGRYHQIASLKTSKKADSTYMK
jgi:hypothetical protein